MKPLEALKIAARLEQIGITVRSPELKAESEALDAFYARGGNRAMRRAAKRAARRPGR